MQGNDRQGGRQGFTLVELLAMLGIMGVLASLLLPVLAQTKGKSHQILCLSSVHQQSLAVLLYADDNRDFLPPTAYIDHSLTEMDWRFLLRPYIHDGSKVYLCPADRRSAVSSYGLNELAFVDQTDANAPPLHRLQTVKFPSHTVVLGDLGTDSDFHTPRPDTLRLVAPASDLNDLKDARPAARHIQQCDVGFFDGHLEPLELKQFYINQMPANRWFTP